MQINLNQKCNETLEQNRGLTCSAVILNHLKSQDFYFKPINSLVFLAKQSTLRDSKVCKLT